MTKLLDERAVEFFAPKEMHSLVSEFDRLLVRLAAVDATIAKYVELPFAFFDDSKRFPILHLVAMQIAGAWRIHRAPGFTYERREGHRTVSEDGAPLKHGMQPQIRLEVVTDPLLMPPADRAALERLVLGGLDPSNPEFQAYSESSRNASTPAVLFTAPLSMLLRPHAASFVSQRFTLYQHIFGGGGEYPDDGAFYIGITARDWKKRWSEHVAAIRRGSKLAFHKTYRARIGSRRLTYVHHKVMGVAPTLERIQDLEEALVRGHWEDARLLNMIPGGRAGLNYLQERGWIRDKKSEVPETAERTLGQWLVENPRKGLPAPWIAELWKSDDYALSVICGPEGRLSVEQVAAIRAMARDGVAPGEILRTTGARSLDQVQRVIAGRTYARVPEE